MELVGIVGHGRMGSALAAALTERGVPVLLGGRDTGAARVAARAGLVVLATPIAATLGEVATAIRPYVAGKPVVDVSNPFFEDNAEQPAGPAAAVADGLSVAERLARRLPAGHVVKALTCVAASHLCRAARESEPLTVPIAGDQPAAKAAVASIVSRLGFEPLDVGPLNRSRWMENLTECLVRLGGPAPGHIAGFRLVRFTPRPAVAGLASPARTP
jgi:predicted dinucleotide-binding enzyme